MTAQQTYRLGHIDRHEPFQDGATVTVVDEDGATVFTARGWLEPGPIATEAAGPVAVVAADGDIDMDTAPVLRRVLTQALDSRATVCCDLGQVTFFGAAAANLLLAMHRRATETGHLLVLRNARAMTEHVLAVVDPYHVIARY
jgi:anti-anti-sigma factor